MSPLPLPSSEADSNFVLGHLAPASSASFSADVKLLAQGLMKMQGIRHAHLMKDKAEIQMDFECDTFKDVLALFKSTGYDVKPLTHHLVMGLLVGEGKKETLIAQLENVRGVARARIDKENTLWVVCAGKPKTKECEAAIKESGFRLNGKLLKR